MSKAANSIYSMKLRHLTYSSAFLILTVFFITSPAVALNLTAMGDNDYGKLGDGTTTMRDTPVMIATDVIKADAGFHHSLFIKNDNTLWGMGNNLRGQLGDGTTTDRLTPVLIATNVAQAAAGDGISMFVKNDDTLWRMGCNYTTEVNDSTKSPAQLATDVIQVAVGYSYALFIKTDNTLWKMDLIDPLQIGHADNVQIAIDVAQVAISHYPDVHYSVFIKNDGTLWFLGRLMYIVKDPHDADKDRYYFFNADSPLQIATDVFQVAAGYRHLLFIKNDGTLWAMGNNCNGELGDGTHDPHTTPIKVATNVTRVAAGCNNSFFIKTDNTLWAMGVIANGDMVETEYKKPVQIGNDFYGIDAGLSHTLFLQSPTASYFVPDNTEDNDNGGGGCFIATAAY
ncbi:MAG: hypothetical protein JW944_02460 [Deltaproteobacteria bacterium]|nr:hypothetical protein [Deltaproteobacteria bacterium]